MTDQAVASIARLLAEALSAFAYSRKDEDKKRVAELQYSLCRTCREEQAEEEAKPK